MRRFGRPAAAALLALSASGLAAGPVAAADPVTFGQPRATSAFGKSIEFDQQVEITALPDRKSTRLNSSHPVLSRMPSSA